MFVCGLGVFLMMDIYCEMSGAQQNKKPDSRYESPAKPLFL